MTISGPNIKLRHFIKTLKDYLSNSTYNITETDFQLFIKYVNETSTSESLTTDSLTDVNCGYQLQKLAENYAKTYHSYFAIVICIFGITANVLNVIVLTRKDMVSVPINRILIALAVTDFLVMVDYIPYVCYYYMVLAKNLDFPYLGAVYMMAHVHVTQTLHTASICLTLMLAVWRYLALGFPKRTHVLCSNFRCSVGITTSYFLSFILCIPAYTTLTITSQEIFENNTKFTLYHTDLSENFKTNRFLLELNFWFYAVFIKLLPCCILTIISTWLIKTLVITNRRKQTLRHYHCVVLHETADKVRPLKTERRTERTTKMLVAVLFLFLLTEFPQGIFALLIGIKGKDLFLDCYQRYGELMDILALFSGAVNFILYCFMNRMFRMVFGQLFKRRFVNWTTPCGGRKTRFEENRTQTTET